jgi:hypothetical protein
MMNTSYLKHDMVNVCDYLKANGLRIYRVQKTPKKKKVLSLEERRTIQQLFNVGCKKTSLRRRFGLTRYMLDKVLKMKLESSFQ